MYPEPERQLESSPSSRALPEWWKVGTKEVLIIRNTSAFADSACRQIQVREIHPCSLWEDLEGRAADTWDGVGLDWIRLRCGLRTSTGRLMRFILYLT